MQTFADIEIMLHLISDYQKIHVVKIKCVCTRVYARGLPSYCDSFNKILQWSVWYYSRNGTNIRIKKTLVGDLKECIYAKKNINENLLEEALIKLYDTVVAWLYISITNI